MAELEVKEQCKKCFHFQVCANILKSQLFIREKMLNEKNPLCEHFKSVADVVEVVHGRWETRMLGDDVGYKCSACHLTSDWDTPYCPQCGALMDGKEV